MVKIRYRCVNCGFIFDSEQQQDFVHCPKCTSNDCDKYYIRPLHHLQQPHHKHKCVRIDKNKGKCWHDNTLPNTIVRFNISN